MTGTAVRRRPVCSTAPPTPGRLLLVCTHGWVARDGPDAPRRHTSSAARQRPAGAPSGHFVKEYDCARKSDRQAFDRTLCLPNRSALEGSRAGTGLRNVGSSHCASELGVPRARTIPPCCFSALVAASCGAAYAVRRLLPGDPTSCRPDPARCQREHAQTGAALQARRRRAAPSACAEERVRDGATSRGRARSFWTP